MREVSNPDAAHVDPQWSLDASSSRPRCVCTGFAPALYAKRTPPPACARSEAEVQNPRARRSL